MSQQFWSSRRTDVGKNGADMKLAKLGMLHNQVLMNTSAMLIYYFIFFFNILLKGF